MVSCERSRARPPAGATPAAAAPGAARSAPPGGRSRIRRGAWRRPYRGTRPAAATRRRFRACVRAGRDADMNRSRGGGAMSVDDRRAGPRLHPAPRRRRQLLGPADFRGRKLVLYFYPKDDTPGCTIEALDFTARAAGVRGGGHRGRRASRRTASKSHDRFRDKHGLAIAARSPTRPARSSNASALWGEKTMYGRTFMGIERATFLDRRSGHRSPGLAEGQGRRATSRRCSRRRARCERGRRSACAHGRARATRPAAAGVAATGFPCIPSVAGAGSRFASIDRADNYQLCIGRYPPVPPRGLRALPLRLPCRVSRQRAREWGHARQEARTTGG